MCFPTRKSSIPRCVRAGWLRPIRRRPAARSNEREYLRVCRFVQPRRSTHVPSILAAENSSLSARTLLKKIQNTDRAGYIEKNSSLRSDFTARERVEFLRCLRRSKRFIFASLDAQSSLYLPLGRVAKIPIARHLARRYRDRKTRPRLPASRVRGFNQN